MKLHQRIRLRINATLILALGLGAGHELPAQEPGGADAHRSWRSSGGGPDNIHFSEFDQINRGNVGNLKAAWKFDSGDASPGSELECTPIVIGRTLFATTPKLRVVALDAATGKLRWSFDPNAGLSRAARLVALNRGVTYWASGSDHRIFVVAREFLWAIDAQTGLPIPGFGQSGKVDLRFGLGRDPETVAITSTSPGVVYRDLFILGSTVPEDLPAAPGDIRAFDVRTGEMRWIFHTIPHPGEFGYETWPKDAWKTSGGVNCWAGMALDQKRGIAFIPTGSASFDPYGADRIGDDLFANCLLAIHADTGKLAWYFQAVKHDLWDRDLPAPPSLVTVMRNGHPVDAVAQITKSGQTFVFDRDTGEPLFPIEYRKVPPSDVDGEKTAETQPFAVLPQPFEAQTFTEDLVTNRTPQAHQAVLDQLRGLRFGGQFIPPSLQGTLVYPGLDGGGEWGGGAFDPASRLFYVNADSMVSVIRLKERMRLTGRVGGRALYLQSCASCHGEDKKGTSPRFPSLIGVGQKLGEAQIAVVVAKGGGLMPPLAALGSPAIRAIAHYVASNEDLVVNAPKETHPFLKYVRGAPIRLFDPDGYPPTKTPWGTLNAIDLDTGELAWQVPLGQFPELVQQGLPDTGSENYGGPLVTAGGLVFIGATVHDSKFRAFDKATGKLLWEAGLPGGGCATPATYEIDGRQYVVIAAGGHHPHFGKSPSAATYVAFALP